MYKHAKARLVGLIIVSTLILGLHAPCIAKAVFTHRMVEVSLSLHGNKNVRETARVVIDKVAGAGYNGVLCADDFHDLERGVSQAKVDAYRDMLAYIRSKGLYTVPDALHQSTPGIIDSSVMEGIPVKGTRFLVNGKTALVSSDHSVAIKNGGFDQASSNSPSHWGRTGLGLPGKHIFMQGGCLKVAYPPGLVTFTQRIDGLKPWRAYELSVRIRTQKYTNAKYVKFNVWGDNRYLLVRHNTSFGRWQVPKTTGGFRECTVDFNSMENTGVKIELVAARQKTGEYPGGSDGTILFDDARIREVGLYENIRRESCPVKVYSEDGKTVYKEGTDYEVAPSNWLLDANRRNPLGQKLIIPDGSALKQSQAIRVDWYQTANMERVFAPSAFCGNKVWRIVSDQIASIDDLFEYKKEGEDHSPLLFFCRNSEWRNGFWDPACIAKYKTAGEYMGSSVAKTSELLKKPNSSREVLVWSDMFDYYHYAHDGTKNHFMVNGNPYGSWKSLPKDIVMVRWWFNKQGIRFFAGKDPKFPEARRRQISLVYDPGSAQAYERAVTELEAEGADPAGFPGIVYGYSHYYNHAHVEAVARVFRIAGRWGTNKLEDAVSVKENTRKLHHPDLGIRMRANGKLEYRLQSHCHVRLSLVDMRGRTARVLADGAKPAGSHKVRLSHHGLGAGTYIACLQIDGNGSSLGKTLRSRVILF